MGAIISKTIFCDVDGGPFTTKKMLKCVYVFVSGCVIYLSIYLFVYSSNILAVMIVRWKLIASHAV